MDVLLAGFAPFGSNPEWLGAFCLPSAAIVRLKMSLLFLTGPTLSDAAFFLRALPSPSSNAAQPSRDELAILDHPDLALAENVWIVVKRVDNAKKDRPAALADLARAINASSGFGAACARAGLDGPEKWPQSTPMEPGDPYGAIRATLEAAALRGALREHAASTGDPLGSRLPLMKAIRRL